MRWQGINVRVDEPSILRLREIALAKKVSLSDVVRELIWKEVRVPIPGNGDGRPDLPPTFEEIRSHSLQELARRFQDHHQDRDESDQLRWIRASCTELPGLESSDPHWVLFQLRLRVPDPPPSKEPGS